MRNHVFAIVEIGPNGFNFNDPYQMRCCRVCGVPEPCVAFSGNPEKKKCPFDETHTANLGKEEFPMPGGDEVCPMGNKDRNRGCQLTGSTAA